MDISILTLYSCYLILSVILLNFCKVFKRRYIDQYCYYVLNESYNSWNLGSVFNSIKGHNNPVNVVKLHVDKGIRDYSLHILHWIMTLKDTTTAEHEKRLYKLIEDFALSIHLPKDDMANLKLLALFHDIGKIGISGKVLNKTGYLSYSEYRKMQKHCKIGSIIAGLLPQLAPVSDLILKHHERWDGKGYPLGLKEYSIPLECRILAIFDAYDAMVNDRPYRKAMKREEAVVEILRCSGSQFDPELVPRFINTISGGKIR